MPLEKESCQAIEVSREAERCASGNPLFYRNLQHCEELEWWQEHLTRWNGCSLLSRKPDMILETDAIGWGAGQEQVSMQGKTNKSI
jgi:hypothetical protein